MMHRERVGLASAAGVVVACVALAFAVAPHACQGGFELYFWSGCAALLVLAVLPFAARMGRSLLARCAWAIVFVAAGAGAWLVGMFAANVRFICGLGYL